MSKISSIFHQKTIENNDDKGKSENIINQFLELIKKTIL